MTLEALIEEVKALPPTQQQQLRVWLDTQLSHTSSSLSEEEMMQKLYERGTILSLPARSSSEEFDQYKPVPVIGKPISETIIEERR